MRRRSRAASQAATRRRKTVKRRNAAKAVVGRGSFTGSQGTKAPSSNVVTDRPIETLTQISQALSSEIVIDKLIEILMRVAIEHAGADRGLLVLLEDDAQRIEAEATAGRDRIEVRIHGTNVTTSELPVSIIQYVVRTLESVILDDASVHNQFSADHYFSQKRCRSIFCLPLVRQTKLIGVLYLENTFGSHVFTPARVSLLKLLASQAAISIENARLYADLGDRAFASADRACGPPFARRIDAGRADRQSEAANGACALAPEAEPAPCKPWWGCGTRSSQTSS